MSQEKEKEPFTKVTLLGSSWLNYNDWTFLKHSCISFHHLISHVTS